MVSSDSNQPTPAGSDFEFSLTEIQSQLNAMGITDVSTSALRHFQTDLQHLVSNDITSKTANQPTSHPTISENSLVTLSQNSVHQAPSDDEDDAVSIISTTHSSFMNLSKPNTRTRKVIRNGVISSQLFDTTFDTTSELNASIDTLTPRSENSQENVEDLLHGTSLYDDKIDKFVKALLEGDDTVLEEYGSQFSDDFQLAAGLNKNARRRTKSGEGEIDVEQLPPPPSFIRPSTAPTAGRRVNWHDPVRRYAEYTNYWKNQPRCNLTRDHKRTTRTKWQVRNELADLVRYNDEKFSRAKEDYHQYNSQPTTQSHSNQIFKAPTEKTRNDIRWQVRNLLHDSNL